MRRSSAGVRCGLIAAIATLAVAVPVSAQNRGVYPLGMSATNSGVTPALGFTYANQLLFYARDHATDDEGNTVASGSNTVIMDMNTLTWVSNGTLMGARFSMSATIPIAKNSLTSDLNGPISGGSGLADSYYLPIILGWKTESFAVRAMYGFLAPTGRFTPGADDNVGSGYWTHTLSSGQTWYPTEARRLIVSAFEMYELHTEQDGTGIQPGDTFDFDCSVMGAFSSTDTWRLQAGLAGYAARQTTAKKGPGVGAAASEERYAVNAIGFALNVVLPKHEASVGLKYFTEFANRSTYEGYSVQFAGAISF